MVENQMELSEDILTGAQNKWRKKMENEEFMQQSADEMTIAELAKAIRIKTKEKPKFKVGDWVELIKRKRAHWLRDQWEETHDDWDKPKQITNITSEGRLIINSCEYNPNCFKKSEEKPTPLTFAEEIKKFPERFERLTGESWVSVVKDDSVCYNGTAMILNSSWNNRGLDGKVFYVEFTQCSLIYKEIIRRKEEK